MSDKGVREPGIYWPTELDQQTPDVERLLETLKDAVEKRRATCLDVTEHRKLQDWAQHVVAMFRGNVPYLVGSVLDDPKYRDVDVRLILDDDTFTRLTAIVDLNRLGFLVSLWGQQTTGLRIDFQIQEQTTANEEFKGPRHAIGLHGKAG